MSALAPLMAKLAAEGFQAIWLGSGVNASSCAYQMVPAGEQHTLSRIMYLPDLRTVMWPKVFEFAKLPFMEATSKFVPVRSAEGLATHLQ